MYHNTIIIKVNHRNDVWRGFRISALILSLALNSNTHNFVFGHTFSGDESASFLSKVQMIKIESQLAQQQLTENDTHLNKTKV